MDDEELALLTEIRDMLRVVVPLLKEYEPLLKRFASPSSIWKRTK